MSATMMIAGMPTSPADPGGYVSAAEVRRRHPHLTLARLYRLAALGAIRTQALPGVPMRYGATDAARYADAPRANGR